MTSPRERVVVVTGAAGGIGQATVSVFRAEGWRVVGMDRRSLPVEPNEIHLQVDMSEPDAVSTAFRRLPELGVDRIDALVNNAAVQVTKRLVDTTPEEWDLVMASNVRSVYLATRAAYPQMQHGGAIVNISSVHAIATSAGIAAYAASKGALLALTRAMALELTPEGIRVNAVLPGAVDTHMLRSGLDRRPEDGGAEAALQVLAERTPVGRIGDPAEIAQAILFLADAARSSFMTGQAIVVDGGATTRLSTE